MSDIQRVCDWAALGDEYNLTGPVRLEASDGVIQKVDFDPAPCRSERYILPCPANAHDHARPLSTIAFGIPGSPLETWLPHQAIVPSVPAYTAAAASLARAAAGGSASVMMHCVRPQGLTDIETEVADVSWAARDVGVRLAFAMGLKDRNPLVYGDTEAVTPSLSASARKAVEHYFRTPETSVAEQLERVEAAARGASQYGVDVQYGPVGPQWCSDALLRGVAEASSDTGRRVHMHLLETPHQRAYADRNYPQGVVQYLKDIGLLSPRLTLAHCVWATDEELALIAEAGATIVVNNSSNMHLKSGRARLRAMLDHGCRVALGVDGCALDDDDDALRELRLGSLLHNEAGVGGGLDSMALMASATSAGRQSLGVEGSGALKTGAPADWIALDLRKLNREQVMDVDPWTLFMARGNRACLDELVVGGRPIVQDGEVTGIDMAALHQELVDHFRKALPERADIRSAWTQLEPALVAFYKGLGGCGH